MSPGSLRRRSYGAAAAAAVCALALGGCTHQDDAAPSPAQTAGADRVPGAAASAMPAAGHRARCVTSDPEGELILQPATLTPQSDLVLDDVALVDPVNVEIVEKDVVAFGGTDGVQGIVVDYPPLKTAGLVDSLADWDQRRPLVGLGLGPGDGRQAVLVAVRLVDATRPGHVSGVVLRTDAGAQSFRQTVLAEPPGAVCTVAEVDSTLDWVP